MKPKGAKNIKPSARDLREYQKRLREAADGGDVLAQAAVLFLAECHRGTPTTAQEG